MNQKLTLSRPICARNAGVFILVRMLFGSLIFFLLNTIFYVPSEAMLSAVIGIKANVFPFIGVFAALVVMSFLSLVVAFPLNNVLTKVNKNLSKRAMQMRSVEVLFFIAGMVLLFFEIPLFYQTFLLGLAFFGLHLITIGYLIFKSGFVSNVLGILLIIGGSFGYIFGSITGFLVPSMVWLSTIGILFAVILEISLGILLLLSARKALEEEPDPRVTIVTILEDKGEATTSEIIEEASMVSPVCQDRVPRTLTALEVDNVVAKKFSKEKKGYVWTLVS